MERYRPMLAVPALPFDAADYLFEVKWNGIRALAGSAAGSWKLWGRELADYGDRYPELAGLSRLPPGTVLDGEMVLLAQGRPDLEALLARHALAGPHTLRWHSRERPVTYVVFDLLCAAGRPVLSAPLEERRTRAEAVVRDLADPRVVFSAGVVGAGREFFAQAVRQGQEGVMAKHRSSCYVPGRRSAAWKKIKPFQELPCAVIGFLPGAEGVRGLLVAAASAGRLRYVGLLRSGFTAAARQQLQARLAVHRRLAPVVPCRRRGVWVEPVLVCRVRFLEWTRHGFLHGASFRGLIETASAAAGSGKPQALRRTGRGFPR
jgi:bifunctional non-homologous end joining protein LigD